MTSLVPALKNGLRSLVAIRQLNLSRKAALLTFDDGPHPEVTQKVLNLLRKYSARAVFFVAGREFRVLRICCRRSWPRATSSGTTPSTIGREASPT
jgi:peptidoglycan/xylan/chitin deacetylase (PgdA/CDA1 family)